MSIDSILVERQEAHTDVRASDQCDQIEKVERHQRVENQFSSIQIGKRCVADESYIKVVGDCDHKQGIGEQSSGEGFVICQD